MKQNISDKEKSHHTTQAYASINQSIKYLVEKARVFLANRSFHTIYWVAVILFFLLGTLWRVIK